MQSNAPGGDKQPEDASSSSFVVPPPKCEVTINSAGRKVVRKTVYRKVVRVMTRQKILCADGTIRYNTIYTTRPVDDVGVRSAPITSDANDINGSAKSPAANEGGVPGDTKPAEESSSSVPVATEPPEESSSSVPVATEPPEESSSSVPVATEAPEASNSSVPKKKVKVGQKSDSHEPAKTESPKDASSSVPVPEPPLTSVSNVPVATKQPQGSDYRGHLETKRSEDDTSAVDQGQSGVVEPDGNRQKGTSTRSYYRWWEDAQHSLKGGPVFETRCKPFSKDPAEKKTKPEAKPPSGLPREVDTKENAETSKSTQDAGRHKEAFEKLQDPQQPAEKRPQNLAVAASAEKRKLTEHVSLSPTEKAESLAKKQKIEPSRNHASTMEPLSTTRDEEKKENAPVEPLSTTCDVEEKENASVEPPSTTSDVEEKENAPVNTRAVSAVPFERLRLRFQRLAEEKQIESNKAPPAQDGHLSVTNNGDVVNSMVDREKTPHDYAMMRTFNEIVFPYLYSQDRETGALTCLEEPPEVANFTERQWDDMHEPSELSARGWRRVPLVGETSFGKQLYQWKKLKNVK